MVQLYVKDLKSSVQRPLKQLVGFKRIPLNIGESKTISFEVPMKDLMFWDDSCHDWVLEKGKYEFMRRSIKYCFSDGYFERFRRSRYTSNAERV